MLNSETKNLDKNTQWSKMAKTSVFLCVPLCSLRLSAERF
jgi:hypothetical protein